MSAVNLNLSKDNLVLELTKSGVEEIIPCQVSFQLDVSGSFHLEHLNGYTNNLLNRILPFALLFDKDGVLDMFSFSHESVQLEPVTANNHQDYVLKNVMTANNYNGWSTNYLPALADLFSNGLEKPKEKSKGFLNKLFGKKEQHYEQPVSIGKHLSFFVTDGVPSDGNQVFEYLNSKISEDHFIVFISIGIDEINYLKDNFKSRLNTDYFNMTPQELRDLKNKSDSELYQMFLSNSLVNWMNK
jgi:hypothetical protein